MQKTETVVCDNVIATCHLGESEKVSVNVFDNRENHIENHTEKPLNNFSHVVYFPCGMWSETSRPQAHSGKTVYTKQDIETINRPGKRPTF